MKTNMANVLDEDEKLTIELSAPGFNKEDFTIELIKNELQISGEVQKQEEKEEKDYLRKEFNSNSFLRKFSLPENINDNNISAHYENGILKIMLPKKQKESALSKRITIA